MPAAEEISEIVIRENIARAVADVFKTMLGRPVSLDTSVDEKKIETHLAANGVPQVVGTVGFIGEANGLVYLYMDETFASQCTGQILGMTDFELQAAGDDVVNDAIGELTNMVVGSFKNALCDAGYSCKLTIPSIVRGSNFIIEPISSATRHIYYFDCADHRVVADILLQKEE